ncbi:MAG: hypothetical protein AAGD10_03055 [Myxococcota bacterium]
MSQTAVVTTLEGRSFEVPIQNLTATTVFIATAQPLGFGDDLILTLLGHNAAANVVFTSIEPRGAVLSFDASPELHAAIDKHVRGVPVSRPPPIDADAWREVTNSGLETSPSRLPRGNSDFEEPKTDPALDVFEAIEGAERLSAPSPVAVSTPPVPAPDQQDDADPIPVLDSDGYTVRFASVAAYRHQYDEHVEHGGLVARGGPVRVGQQKMLVLEIPGRERYTVSARVMFNSSGQVGFMFESFALHKDRLRQLAGQ